MDKEDGKYTRITLIKRGQIEPCVTSVSMKLRDD